MDTYTVTLAFTEPLLGTVPRDPEVYKTFIQGRAADLGDEDAAQELATVASAEEKGWTGFHQKDGCPVLYDYAVKGFFKEACGALRRVPGTKSNKISAYKKIINGLVFVEPRQIRLDLNGGAMGTLERPLRAQTAQGERVTLARSDSCPPGTTMTFTVTVLGGPVTREILEEWLAYGRFSGLGQWRSGGYGRFTYEIGA